MENSWDIRRSCPAGCENIEGNEKLQIRIDVSSGEGGISTLSGVEGVVICMCL